MRIVLNKLIIFASGIKSKYYNFYKVAPNQPEATVAVWGVFKSEIRAIAF